MRARAFKLLVTAIPIAALAACSSAGGSSSSAGSSSSGNGAQTTNITVGFDSPQAYTNNMPVLIAIKNDYFAKHGLNVQTIGFSAGSDAVKALVSNTIQIQAGVGFDVVSAQAKNLPAQAFCGLEQNSEIGRAS